MPSIALVILVRRNGYPSPIGPARIVDERNFDKEGWVIFADRVA